MTINDKAVLTAALGYVFIGDPGTAAPTPAELKTLVPESFGLASTRVVVTGAPTGGSLKLGVKIGSAAVVEATVAFNADVSEIQTALEGVAGVGAGNVKVTAVPGTRTAGQNVLDVGVDIAFVGALAKQTVVVTAITTGLTGGTSPAATAVASRLGTGWTNIGHTSRGDLPEFGFEGGDTEVRGTWQNESLREVVTKPIADYLTMFLHQFDTATFELYYGKNASKAAGVFGVAGGTPTPVEHAVLVIIVDGDHRVAFYSPKASIRRDDSITLATDDFAALPVRATFLKYQAANKYEWISELFA